MSLYAKLLTACSSCIILPRKYLDLSNKTKMCLTLAAIESSCFEFISRLMGVCTREVLMRH